MLVPDGGKRTRMYRPYGRLKWLGAAAGLLVLGCVAMMGSWGYLTVRANQAGILEGEVAQLLERGSRVEELAESLAEVEAAYDGPTASRTVRPAGRGGAAHQLAAD